MKKIALNLLKSADEKLRSIGNKPQQQQQPTPVPLQPHPFTHPQPHHHSHHHPQQQQQQHHHQQQRPTVPPPPVPAREPVMAERRVQMRQGRRDRRRDGDGDTELKRRSRSEGPSSRRLAQSMDVSSVANNAGSRKGASSQGNGHFDRKGQAGKVSPAGSDEGEFANPDPSGSDSDSDSDRQKWTKNPLLVRRMKKNKSGEKRNSCAENSNAGYTQLGQRNTNRESWVYLAPEGTPLTQQDMTLTPAQDQQRQDTGGSSSGSMKSKYQKLEERRNKRLDMAVTSDEENTPESRISRLRQRALQGALGGGTPTDNARVTVSDHNGLAAGRPWAGQAVMSDQGSRPRVQGAGQYGVQSVPAQPQAYRSGVVVQSAQRQPQPGAVNSQHRAPSTQPITPFKNAGQSFQQAHPGPAPLRQNLVRPFTDRNEPSSPANASSRQQFYTIPEPRTVHTSSPEIQVRRLNPAVRVPSADSIYDTVNYAPELQGSRPMSGQRAFAQVRPPQQDVMEVRRGVTQQSQVQAQQRLVHPATSNEMVELRLKSTRVIDRPLSQSFSQPKRPSRQAETAFHSDDSLDELIESNIQYLDKEIKHGGAKTFAAPVSRSSSLPDQRKTGVAQYNASPVPPIKSAITPFVPFKSPAAPVKNAAPSWTPVVPRVTVSGQQSARPLVQPPSPTSKSELHFRVPLAAPTSAAQSTPQILIAEENQWSDSAYPGPNTTYTFGAPPSRPERKYSYDSRTRGSRPSSEYYDRDDMSKSDSQLNAAVVTPTYRGSMLHPNYAAARGCISDQNLMVEPPQGMFSDVEYDIEVSERVKKWEKYMKNPLDSATASDGKKSVLLTPIDERTEGDRDCLMMPSEVRRSMRMPQAAGGDEQLAVMSLKPATSDPVLHSAADARVLSKETNLHRFFQVVQEPSAGLQLAPSHAHSTSSVYIDLPHAAPRTFSHSASLFQPGGLMTPEQLRRHMLENQRSRADAERGPPQPQLSLTYTDAPAPDSSEQQGKRLSRYQDEIEEMRNVKHQSVSHLRRRFDEGKAMTSGDESQHEVSDSRVAKVSPTQKEDGDVNWSRMITGLEGRIRDMEVWSPNMESTEGSVVSIERVKARTLQTIPFSEDPFWKEIEEMTSFDPNSLGGHLALSEELLKPVTAQTAESAAAHSSTLPNQPRQHSTVSLRERLQRSKSLYTPNITPLTITVDPYCPGKTSSLERGASADKLGGTHALDDVLEDIRTSLERKPLSPKRRAAAAAGGGGESSDSHRSSPGPSFSESRRPRLDRLPRANTISTDAAPMGSYDNVTVSNYNANPSSSSSAMSRPVAITISSNQKTAPQPPQLAPAPAAAAGIAGMAAGHYHLDANLLKQKLLSTGLVEEERAEMPVRSRGSPLMPITALSKPVAVAPPQAVVRSVAVAPAQAVVRSVVAPTQRAVPAVIRTSQQQDKLSQVNDSMEDLRQLAVSVERKIGQIKTRLLTADDHNLDSILLALRRCAPCADPQAPEPSSMRDFYHSKKSKLQDALSELDRIYSGLGLDTDMLAQRADRRDYPSYRVKPVSSSLVSSGPGLGMSSPGYHKASSIYISPVPVATVKAETARTPTRVEVDRQTESEFDMISKSFQAIIDEVNKTANLVSGASSSSSSSAHPRSQPRPLPEIKELQSKVYASKAEYPPPAAAPSPATAPSPDLARRTLNVTLASQEVKVPPGSLGVKAPPAIAPKPPFRVQMSNGQQGPPSQQQVVVNSVKVPGSSPTPITVASVAKVPGNSPTPVTLSSTAKAEVVQPAPEKREPRVRARFRPKAGNSERDEASKRARSKSSPTITLQDLGVNTEAKAASTAEAQPTAKTQVSFQIEPVASKPQASKKPSLRLDVVKAQLKGSVELQLKPPAMFQDRESPANQPVVVVGREHAAVLAQPFIVKPAPDNAPALDRKTVVYPGSPTVTATASTAPPPTSLKQDASSSESSAENRSRADKQKLGQGVAMMVELFSSSDEERLRRTHPLHTRSAPDLSADLASDDSTSVSKEASAMRPAELSRVLQQRSEKPSQVSPGPDRKTDALNSPQSPSTKPPCHPLRRQKSSPDRASDSPQRNAAPASPETSLQPAASTTAASPRLRHFPPTDDPLPERPRSFHELVSSFEPNPQRLSRLRCLRKSASEDWSPEQLAVVRHFRSPSCSSEPEVNDRLRHLAPTPQELRQWKL